MDEKELLPIARVTGVHGLKGYLRIFSFAESTSIFRPGLELMAKDSNGQGDWHEIVKASPHKKGLLVLFKGLDRNLAEGFVGKELFIPRAKLPDLEEDTFFWEDLIGLEVTDIRAGYLGRIDSVIETGSNDVFVVTGGPKEVLVPSLAWVVLAVDLDNKTMTIDLPEGL